MKMNSWIPQTLILTTSLTGMTLLPLKVQAANIAPVCDTSTTYGFMTVYQNSSNGICPPSPDWSKQMALEWRGGVVGQADYEFGYGENGANDPLAGSIYRDWTNNDKNQFYNWSVDYTKATKTFVLTLEYSPSEIYTRSYTSALASDQVSALSMLAKVNDKAANYTSYISVDQVISLDGQVAQNGSSPLAIAQFTGNNSSSSDPTFTELALLGQSGTEIKRVQGKFMMNWLGSISPSDAALRSNITMDFKLFDGQKVPESNMAYALLALLGGVSLSKFLGRGQKR